MIVMTERTLGLERTVLGEKMSLRSERSPIRWWNDGTGALGKDQGNYLVHREKQVQIWSLLHKVGSSNSHPR